MRRGCGGFFENEASKLFKPPSTPDFLKDPEDPQTPKTPKTPVTPAADVSNAGRVELASNFRDVALEASYQHNDGSLLSSNERSDGPEEEGLFARICSCFGRRC